MALWKCTSCGKEIENRCRPAKCDCGASKEDMVKSDSQQKTNDNKNKEG